MDSVTLSTESEPLKPEQFQVQDEDLISKFHDHLLLKILSFLPLKEIVITSALSTRWQHLNTFFPRVSFDFRPGPNDQGCAGFIKRVQRELLVLPDNARIRNFHLHWNTHPFSSSHIPVAMSAISKAVKHKVEELCFWTFRSSPAPVLFSLPPSLFNSHSLICLMLYMPKVVLINFPTSICFPRLKTLSLKRIEFKDEHSVQLLLAGCPILVKLSLVLCVWNHKTGITISIPTLKVLRIDIGNSPPLDTTIRISTRNLLNLSLIVYSSVELVPCDLSSVVHAKVGARIMQNNEVQIGSQTLKLLEAISEVKSLEVHARTLEAITFAENFQAAHLPTFYNLTNLNINYSVSIHGRAALMHILHKSPNLLCLNFHHRYNIDASRLLKDPVPACLQRSLKRFITSYFGGCAREVRFLKFVLEHAQVLECISVYCSADLQADSERKEEIECELKQLLRPGCACNFT